LVEVQTRTLMRSLGHEGSRFLLGAEQSFKTFAQRGIRATTFIEEARPFGSV
jgi:hypothetical protein